MILGRYARRGSLKLLKRTPGITDAVAYLTARIIQYVLILLGIGIALAFLGANIQPLLAIVIIIGAVIVLIVKGFAENFTAGMLIQSRQPVRVGDEIQVEGPDEPLSGTVTELNGRSVVMVTVDGRTIHTPNASILNNVLINHSKQGLRRSEVQVRAYCPDVQSLDDLQKLVCEVSARTPGVDSSYKPTKALLQSFGVDRCTLRVQYWHDPLSGPAITSKVIKELAKALEDMELRATITANPGPPPLIPPDSL
ncbi:mechanosensitive ion channel domain-containing protein [Glutamicibacter sp.]|uniref:mechanosensitive ion channel family protein n=1 Tax=Glutamicibacter sp. TaxID=1931995 RepID=UPI0028BEABFA|nr:mechanosensitive ion channel domain-containing protein [Glutamicibacter sp.]